MPQPDKPPEDITIEETMAAFAYREQRPVVLGTLEGETRFPALIAVARAPASSPLARFH